MRFYSLGSGSSGNATLIENEGRYILIDVGITYKELLNKLEELNLSLDKIEAVLFTHTHIDHVRSIKYFDDILMISHHLIFLFYQHLMMLKH